MYRRVLVASRPLGPITPRGDSNGRTPRPTQDGLPRRLRRSSHSPDRHSRARRLIGPNGAVNLLRTTTLAGYHDGVEHYVTAFQFAGGGGGEFGSLVPLPGVPTSVERGGDWTLQRLVRETDPFRDVVFLQAPAAERRRGRDIEGADRRSTSPSCAAAGNEVVGEWATEHGFRLPPDAPEVLDFYATRSPIFLAAVFDGDAAISRASRSATGRPCTSRSRPTTRVPLRILGLGKTGAERVEADVYLLTDDIPAMLPQATGANGLTLTIPLPPPDLAAQRPAQRQGMGWVPNDAWLSKIAIDAQGLTFGSIWRSTPRGRECRRLFEPESRATS